jgi:hypothetical protein
MKCTNNPTTGRALDQSVYEFLVSKTNHDMVFEIKSYLGGGAVDGGAVDGGATRTSMSVPSSPVPDEDEILRKRCRMRKWSL